MKRLLSLILCSLLLPAMPASVSALETDNGFLYTVLSQGYASVTGYTGSETDLVLPSEIMGHPVRSISRKAFAGNGGILSVTLPEGIDSIGDSAFANCVRLVDVSLPSTLTQIGEFAFAGCSALPGIQIHAGVTVIRNKTFASCESLREVGLPLNLKTIGGAAFVNCGFESIDFPQSLAEIGPDAFAACQNLVNIRIPNSVKKIGRLAFGSCVKLESVILPAGLTSMNALFNGCSSLREVAIPKSVKNIAAKEIFDGCDQVTIKGMKGSGAERYAGQQHIPFTAVEPVNEVTISFGGADVSGAGLAIDLSNGNTNILLSARTSPDNPWPGVEWNSSVPKVARVSADGIVTGLKKGKATITATSLDGSKKKAVCLVVVTDSAD
jgi:hypothetical protein